MSKHLSQLEQAHRFSNLRDVDKNRGDIRKVAESCYYRDNPNGKRLPRINDSIKDHAVNWCLSRNRTSNTSYLDKDTGLMQVTFRVVGNRTPDGHWVGSREDFGKQAGLLTPEKRVSADTLTAALRWLEMVGLITRFHKSWKSKAAGEEGKLRYQGSAVIVRFNYPKWTELVRESAEKKRASRNYRTSTVDMETTIEEDGEGSNCRILAVMGTKDAVIEHELSEAALDAADAGFSNDPRAEIYRGRIRVQYASSNQCINASESEADESSRSAVSETNVDEAQVQVERATLPDSNPGGMFLELPRNQQAGSDALEAGPVLTEPAASKGLDPRLNQQGQCVINDTKQGFEVELVIPEEDTVACGSMYFEGHNSPGGSVETRRDLVELSCSPEAFDLYNLFFTAAAKIGVRCLNPDDAKLSQQVLARICSPNMQPDQVINERTIGIVFQSIYMQLTDPADEKERQRAWGITVEHLVAKWSSFVRGAQRTAMQNGGQTLCGHWAPNVNQMTELHVLQLSKAQRVQLIWQEWVGNFVSFYDGKMIPGKLNGQLFPACARKSSLHFWTAFTTYLDNISQTLGDSLRMDPTSFARIAERPEGQMAFLRALNLYKGGDLIKAGVDEIFSCLLFKHDGGQQATMFSRNTLAPVVQGLILEHCPEFAYEGAKITTGTIDLGPEGEPVRRQRLMQLMNEYEEMGIDITRERTIKKVDGTVATIGELAVHLNADPVAQFALHGMN